jgi:hypothetical protein
VVNYWIKMKEWIFHAYIISSFRNRRSGFFRLSRGLLYSWLRGSWMIW